MSALERLLQFDRCYLARIVECRSLDKQERGVLLGFEHFHGGFQRCIVVLHCQLMGLVILCDLVAIIHEELNLLKSKRVVPLN